MPLSVLEARMWSISVVVGVGVPLRARTVLEMVYLDGRAGWRARAWRARRAATAPGAGSAAVSVRSSGSLMIRMVDAASSVSTKSEEARGLGMYNKI